MTPDSYDQMYLKCQLLMFYTLFSLQSNTWQHAPPLNVPRQQLGTGSLGGRLYAVGGSDGYSRLSTVECLSLDTNRWEYINSLNTSRSGVGVGTLGDALYALGGYDGRSCLKTVERYDPLVDVWSLVAPTNITRSFPGKCLTGYIFVAFFDAGVWLLLMENHIEQRFSKCEAHLPWGVPDCFRRGTATEKMKYLSTYTDKDD